jgi:cyclic-di-GMP phosphodiesterase TipF (flagellum assembly factor)
MIRISTIFIAICMVLVAASLGVIVYSVAGISMSDSAIVALTALTFLILYNAVSMRLRDRTDVGDQIADLSRGTADLARQIAEFGRRLAAVEGRVVSANSAGADRIQSVVGEINELGVMVKQLALTVASHEDLLASPPVTASMAVDEPATPPPAADGTIAGDGTIAADSAIVAADGITAHDSIADARTVAAQPVPHQPVVHHVHQPASAAPDVPSQNRNGAQILSTVRNAIDSGRIDIYLQPIVTLPQRKVRFYEAMTRLRDEKDQILTADDFIATAETAGLIARIDHSVMLRCMQVLRRLMVRNKDVGVFCNVAAATLSNAETFAQCRDFLEANRALASSFVLEFKQSTFRALGPAESEHLAALASRGYRFSIDHVADLRIEPRELADRGVRYIKVPAALLLDQKQAATADIHASDLSDLLGRFGIDLIAERIEGERAVVDLLDYDVRFGQGFLFAAPRPLRPESASAAAESAGSPDHAAQDTHGPAKPQKIEAAKIEPPRAIGNAALARRAAGPN